MGANYARLTSISGKKREIIFLGGKMEEREEEAGERRPRNQVIYVRRERKGAVFPSKMDNFIAADFTTQSAGPRSGRKFPELRWLRS